MCGAASCDEMMVTASTAKDRNPDDRIRNHTLEHPKFKIHSRDLALRHVDLTQITQRHPSRDFEMCLYDDVSFWNVDNNLDSFTIH